jgi:hypothetical protein
MTFIPVFEDVQMFDDDDLELSRLALIATTRNAVLYLLARSEERVSEKVGAISECTGSSQEKDQKGDDGGLAPLGVALEDAGDLVPR